MGYLYVLMGKSATGKDSIYGELTNKLSSGLKTAVIYTTRPVRSGEKNGVEYNFVTKKELDDFKRSGKLIESRCFNTVMGEWYYFTADDGEIRLDEGDYILINTLYGFTKIRDYYGKDKVYPIYMEISDKERMHRAVRREDKEKNPNYAELCRRFLADNEDFSEENLKRAGVSEEFRFINDDFDECAEKIKNFILSKK